MLKNTSGQKVGAQLVSAADGSAFTGAVTVLVTVDAGTQATGTVSAGAATHEGNGYHTYAPSQAETNGDLIAFTFTGTGAVPATVQVYTRGGDAFTRLGAPSGASVSADIAAIQAKTVNLPADPADASDVLAATTTIAGYLDTEIAAIKAKTDNLPSDPADASDIAAAFAGVNTKLDTIDDFLDTEIAAIVAAVAALPTANATADALLDRANGIETGLTLRQAMRLIAAANAGKLSGAATTTVAIRNAVADSKARITATVDADGNRTAVTTDLT